MTDHPHPPTPYIIEEYLQNLADSIHNIRKSDLEIAVRVVIKHLRCGSSIFIAGNGGSASTSIHMASDWLSATTNFHPRPRIVALAENVARLTAIANDFSYEEIFAEQLSAGGSGDLLLILSVSGDSPNILLAADEARRRGMTIISALGRDGLCAEKSDHVVLLGDADYGLAEDLHSALIHIVVRTLNFGRARRFGERPQVAVASLAAGV